MRSLIPLLIAALLHTGVSAAERPVVMVLDRSASMRSNDPAKYALDAVQLALATVRPEKPILFVGFDLESEVIAPWALFTDHAQRRAVRDLLADVKFTGRGTRYVEALSLAKDELLSRRAEPGTRVFFLTDGNPDEGSSAIRDAARDYAGQGWIVEAIRINKDADESSPDLRNLAVATRGGYTEVNDPGKLVDHFINLTASENDIFDLDLRTIDDARLVEVPPGTQRLTYIVVKNPERSQRGMLQSLTTGGTAIDLEGPRAYRYPATAKAASSMANIEIASLSDPAPGSYAAAFDGVPAKVYVSLSFPVRVEPLPIPAEVPDGARILPGIVIRHGGSPQGQAMAAATKVQMRLTVPGGIALYEGPASPSGGGATEAMFSTPVQALIPANVSRVGKVPVECSYTLTVGPYRLAKRSGFLIDPSRQAPPPAPSLAVRPGPAVIGPAWTDIPANGSFTISADGEAAGGSVEFPSFGAFSFPQPLALPARESQVSVRFQPAAIGLHRGKASAAHRASGVTIAGPELTAHGYAFTGPTEWRIQGHGPGPAAGWVQRDPASPEQPLQPASAQLADDQGRTASVAVGADGTVTLSGLPPGRPRTVYTGDLVLRYGTLPPRTVRAVYADAPPTTRIAITGSGTAITPGAAWRPGTWATATQEVVMDSGVPGRVVIELSDLTGPDGEILSASRDLRAVVGTAAVSPGRPARFEIRMYRGQDALPGTYRGTAIVVFTPDGGSPERITQPIDVVMP